MGIIIAKFRKKKTTYEVLNKLEDEIKSIEEFRRNTEQKQKKMVGRFIFISVFIYFITALVLYFYFFPVSAYERVLYIIPLIIIPVLLIFIKRILTWYYNRKIVRNQKKLTTLKDEKKKILEEVMDKETYKVAKTILEKFAPDQVRKTLPAETVMATPAKTINSPTLGSMQLSGVRYRGPPNKPGFRPALMPATPFNLQTPNKTQLMSSSAQHLGSGTPLRMARSILPKDRSVLDKMVDYLVGDGPSNRYALICKNCSSHNGMALREEFEYLSFTCCYCTNFNPARKQRPQAPKLNTSLCLTDNKNSDGSNSEADSSSQSEDGEGPIITEPQDEEHEKSNGDSEKLLSDENKTIVENTPTSEEDDSKSDNANPENISSEVTKD